ncbi:MAG: hypothetical protein DRR42_11360 [Gammaproteobacteria bacterium]|nr:MAG: hypothetical protein DRR42_11360 [Gammaproteobacteria bacterium]
MNKRRLSPPNGHIEAANRIIKMVLLFIGSIIIGMLAFETVFGIEPNFIAAFAIVTLLVIGLWLKENR